MGADEALEVLRIEAGWACGPDFDDPDQIRRAWRSAASLTRPSAGGSRERFLRVAAARDVALTAARTPELPAELDRA